MAHFSEAQKKIALILLHNSKTAEELRAQLNIPYGELMEELKGMLKLEVVSKEGFPTKFKLKENITNEVKRRKQMSEEDSNKVKLRAIIELQAIEETLLKKQLEKLKEALEKHKQFKVYSIEIPEITKNGEYFASYMDVNFSVKDFSSLVRFMFFYGPASIEILKPAKIEFSAQDLQDGLIEMSDMVQKYSHHIAKNMNKQELDSFHEKLFKQ